MSPEQKAAYIMAQAAVLNATIAGMQAENQKRQLFCESPAYVEIDFQAAINVSPCHHNAVIKFFEED